MGDELDAYGMHDAGGGDEKPKMCGDGSLRGLLVHWPLGSDV